MKSFNLISLKALSANTVTFWVTSPNTSYKFGGEYSIKSVTTLDRDFGWMDGWMTGWMDGWMDGWKQRGKYLEQLVKKAIQRDLLKT